MARGDMRIKLRPLKAGDVLRIFKGNKGNVKEYFYDFRCFADVQEWTSETLRQISLGQKEEYCIFYHGDFAGMIGFWKSHDRRAEISIWLNPDYQGLGLARDALKILEQIIRKRGIVKVNYLCDLENKSSTKLAEKSGYTEVHVAGIKNAICFSKDLV